MDIVLSIKPAWAKKIIDGTKTIEFRKQIPNKITTRNTIYLYATRPIKKVIGFFTVKRIKCSTKNNIWDTYKEQCGITKKEFYDYFKGYTIGYAIEISNLYVYDKPYDPHVLFYKFKPPRNFCYVKREKAQTCII